MSYKLTIRRSAEKEIRALDPRAKTAVIAAIRALADKPRPTNSKKLAAVEAWRVRVGDYRTVYSVDDDELAVDVLKVGHRREVHR